MLKAKAKHCIKIRKIQKLFDWKHQHEFMGNGIESEFDESQIWWV